MLAHLDVHCNNEDSYVACKHADMLRIARIIMDKDWSWSSHPLYVNRNSSDLYILWPSTSTWKKTFNPNDLEKEHEQNHIRNESLWFDMILYCIYLKIKIRCFNYITYYYTRYVQNSVCVWKNRNVTAMTSVYVTAAVCQTEAATIFGTIAGVGFGFVKLAYEAWQTGWTSPVSHEGSMGLVMVYLPIHLDPIENYAEM